MPAVFSIRKSIKWEDEAEPSEPTSTWVLTAGNDDFVDTRILKATGEPDWLINGKEKTIATEPGFEVSIEFVHQLDSLGDDSGSDVGHFKGLPSGERLECGRMQQPDSGVEKGYEEVWSTLDAISSTPTDLKPTVGEDPSFSSTVWELPNGKGRFITIGKFSQGVATYNDVFQCVRLYEKSVVYKYGAEAMELFGEFIDGNIREGFDWKRTFSD
ncbi:LAFE_0C07470g1_1 [Lachancea fermentati]|uniref:LAFE_0C07470g1_1 n=1 Tax=Lachancea fermentati TaxID=4955 RepID=A0A1G4M9Q5_LACFM|nr:LAFE_0C07470g1_1 [Lachancea fermentati]